MCHLSDTHEESGSSRGLVAMMAEGMAEGVVDGSDDGLNDGLDDGVSDLANSASQISWIPHEVGSWGENHLQQST